MRCLYSRFWKKPIRKDILIKKFRNFRWNLGWLWRRKKVNWEVFLNINAVRHVLFVWLNQFWRRNKKWIFWKTLKRKEVKKTSNRNNEKTPFPGHILVLQLTVSATTSPFSPSLIFSTIISKYFITPNQ